MAEDWEQGGFGLYIHWPFCEAKCPYCDFNSHVSRQIDQQAWCDAYLTELDRAAAETPGRVLRSVFFGGGTPSLMAPETVGQVIEKIRKNWACANDLEITLEANPGSVEAGRFRAFRDGGVNRISMGIQALNDPDLRKLGRLHSTDEALKAFEIARATFDRVSFDLIYARQGQSLAAWRAELEQALSLAVDHLSLYQLTIEQGTAFGDRYNAGKLRGLPDEDLSADLFTLTQELCDKHGLPAYEVSNHAGDGAQSIHNLIYWRYGDYIGIGPGAHGRLTMRGHRYATECHSNPARWLHAVQEAKSEKERTRLDAGDQASEFLLMGLRLKEGISRARFEKLAGRPLSPTKIGELTQMGMLCTQGDKIIFSEQGFMILNAVIATLLED
ncbi:radical SAM family heme chaperone HemW [uncultured Roseobacter sp.]|uniref:radical SAM family heme chaperone HemW n=1 Tax=uncultured Roseobacter sp. TaxID=114847 RepID=UPI002628186A|nr:radical SAM family heme chaperone HemW [uncultured Roseobacter sp.]